MAFITKLCAIVVRKCRAALQQSPIAANCTDAPSLGARRNVPHCLGRADLTHGRENVQSDLQHATAIVDVSDVDVSLSTVPVLIGTSVLTLPSAWVSELGLIEGDELLLAPSGLVWNETERVKISHCCNASEAFGDGYQEVTLAAPLLYDHRGVGAGHERHALA